MIATTPTEEAALTPAVDDHGTDAQLRLARADIARLKLELRALLRAAEAAERQAETESPEEETSGVDFAAARGLLALSLGHHLDARRAELAAELEEVRAEAASLIESAHKRAEEYLATAHTMVFDALLGPDDAVEPLPPLPLEAVPEPDLQPAANGGREEPTHPIGVADETLSPHAIAAALQPYLSGAVITIPSAAAAPKRKLAGEGSRPPLRSRVLHLDVLLPLVAVAAVLLILLAWVG